MGRRKIQGNLSIGTHMGLEQDTAQCDKAADIEPCAIEADETAENSITNESIASEEPINSEPYVGMQFESDGAAETCYNNYAKHVGFSVRIGRQERSKRDKEIISRLYLCSREGLRDKKYTNRKDRIRPERTPTRVGCKAMIMVKKRGPNKWVVTRFEKTHTHELVSPDKASTLRSQQHVSNTTKSSSDSLRHGRARLSNKTLDDQYYKEGGADFEMSYLKPILKTQLPMEEQMAEIYTTTMFLKFQEELCTSLRYIAIKNKDDGNLNTYRVTRFGEENKSHTVVLNLSETRASCTCLMFEFVRILCRHALLVLGLTNVLTLPSHYIVERYKRNVISGVVNDRHGITMEADFRESLTLRYNDLYHRAVKYAEEGSASLDVYSVAVRALQRSLNEVIAAKNNTTAYAQLHSPFNENIPEDNLNRGSQTNHSTEQITLFDPQRRISKGYPANSRMELSLEKWPGNTGTCTVCGAHGHDGCTCSALVGVGEVPTLFFQVHASICMTLLVLWSFGVRDGLRAAVIQTFIDLHSYSSGYRLRNLPLIVTILETYKLANPGMFQWYSLHSHTYSSLQCRA